MLLDLKRGVTYGPVSSRRLGRSLGINLFGSAKKLCTFDCLYCHFGWSDASAAEQLGATAVQKVDDVLGGVAAELERQGEPPAYLTFSGNGEPTLHPEFPALVEGVIGIRDRLAPGVRTAVFSNGSRAGDPRVRDALAKVDVRIMKLDVGNEETFRRFNQPVAGVTLAQVVAGLRTLEDVTLQSMFADGRAGNLDPGDVADWLDKVAVIAPLEVQVYTLARGYPSREIEPAAREKLDAIVALLHLRGIAATAF